MCESTTAWSLPKRLGFLVLAIFLALNAAPMVVGMVPILGDALTTLYRDLWSLVIPWIGRHILGITEPITVLPNGSGDTTWNYVQLFGLVMISLIVGTAWAFADRRRRNYVDLHRWLLVLVRYALVGMMAVYGFAKLFKVQFPFPNLVTLTQTYGESSPMGLAWNFMGYSVGYNVFTGGAEVLAGLLLLSRRTTTLGALLAVGVMAHIVAMNFCYDIPVKLFSSTLLLMSLYLLGDDIRRVADLLIFNRPTRPRELRPYFVRRSARAARVALKTTFVLLVGVVATVSADMSEFAPGAPKPPLHGLYEVESFTLDGVARAPLTTDTLRWRQLIVERYGVAVVRTMDGKPQRFVARTDVDARTVELRTRDLDPRVYTLAYEEPEPEALVLRGEVEGGQVEIRLRKLDPGDFELVKRGFHWVNEHPYNR